MGLSLKFSPSQRRRGVVLVYAMVFAMAAAATLYVSSAVFQTKQRAQSSSIYASQEPLIEQAVSKSIMSALATSLQSGYGLADDNAWTTVASLTSYNYPGWSQFAGTDARRNTLNSTNLVRVLGGALAGSASSGLVASADDSSSTADAGDIAASTFWRFDQNTTATRRITDAYASGFGLNEIFTIPGQKPYRHGELSANREIEHPGAGTVASTSDSTPGPSSEVNHDFISMERFPEIIKDRTDLPFGLGNGMGRWVSSTIEYRLLPEDSGEDLFADLVRTGNNGEKELQPSMYSQMTRRSRIWAVEEPITNYQLLLLDPIEGTWSTTPSIGENSGSVLLTSNSFDVAPKALIYGSISPGFISIFRGSGGASVAWVGSQQSVNSLESSTATSSFSWRISKPGSLLSFGRGVTMAGSASDENRYMFSSLRDFLIAPAKPAEYRSDTSTNNSHWRRRLEIFNSQANRMPRVGESINSGIGASFTTAEGLSTYTISGTATGAAPTYINSILHLRGVSGNQVQIGWTRQLANGHIEEMDSSLGPLNNGQNQFPSLGNIISLKHGASTSLLTPQSIPGLHAAFNDAATPKTKVVLNLDSFVLDHTGISYTAAGNYQAWQAPNEIHITQMGPNNASTNYTLEILGSANSNKADKPLRIVTDAQNIKFTAATTPVGNYRRIILLATNPTVVNLSLTENVGPYYGLLIAPSGISLQSTATWRGTWLVGQQLTVASGKRLTLTPDDGAGFSTPASQNHPASTHQAFLPRYTTGTTASRPVPLLAPRMVWLFE
jgi:hypothetical protein